MSATNATLPALPSVPRPLPPREVGPDRPSSAAAPTPPAAAPPSAPPAAATPTTAEPQESFLDNAREALLGIPSDLMSGTGGTLYEVFTRRHRLRGLGVILVLVALLAALGALLR